ncbi:hypothetical protein [Streptomyces sp. NPDC001508]|uniref:hypothetical protein n=1 Tax=Streptomyces sp. NPDC001508 TaxID=3154656 RepID=UPI00331B203C
MPGRLGGQARFQGVLSRIPVHGGGQAFSQPLPVRRVGEPVPGDRWGRGWHAHGEQFRAADQPAAAQFGRPVRDAGHGGQLLRAGPARAPPGQRRRADVQHGHRARYAAASRFAQHCTVADAQRQTAVQGQPGGVGAERAHGDRDGGGADVQGDAPWQVVDRFAADPHVDETREQPALRCQQHLTAAQCSGRGTVHVDRDPCHPADGGAFLVQRLQAAHTERGAPFARHHPVAHPEGAGPERAGHHGAVPAHREGPVQPQP